MTTESLSRDELEAAVYTDFLEPVLTASTSDLSIMTTLVDTYFDESVLAASNYYDVTNNQTYLNKATIIPLL